MKGTLVKVINIAQIHNTNTGEDDSFSIPESSTHQCNNGPSFIEEVHVALSHITNLFYFFILYHISLLSIYCMHKNNISINMTSAFEPC